MMMRVWALSAILMGAGCMQSPEGSCIGAECATAEPATQVAPARPQLRGELGVPPQEQGMLSAALPPYPVFVAPPPAVPAPPAAPAS